MHPIAHVEMPASTWLAIAFYLQLHDAGHWRVAEICDSEGNRIALQAPVTP